MITKKELQKTKERVKEIAQKTDDVCDPYFAEYVFPFSPEILKLIKKAEDKKLTVEEYKKLKEQIDKINKMDETDAIDELKLEKAINCLSNSGEEYIPLFSPDLEKISQLSLEEFKKLKQETEQILKEKEKQKNTAIALFLLATITGIITIVLSITTYTQQFRVSPAILLVTALTSAIATIIGASLTKKAEKLRNVKPDKYPILEKIMKEVQE
ncbi:hypothetical protein [Persephonella sp. KM09-Lau-8]|uniref:hypothetical protein n=1 Tax=Persephonella sp. KM09-Lau-8 TaxID=1158345 RepID=UPI0018CC583C|nr:hypothetical protein [Persephonella sp. KM09-Lau-8]